MKTATRPSKMVKAIFSEGNDELMVTVDCFAINSDCQPVFSAMKEIQYNEFDGSIVSAWLEARIHFGNDTGSITRFRFGREYSPVLYLTVTRAVRRPDGSYLKLTARDRRDMAKAILVDAKSALKPDDADIVSPGIIRLWWD